MRQILQKAFLIPALIATGTAFQALGETSSSTEGHPIIRMESSAYSVIGEANQTSLLIGSSIPSTYTIVDGFGTRAVEVTQATVDPETGDLTGTWISCKTPPEGVIEIYGNAETLDVLVADGAYITSIDMEACANLEILSLEYNALECLDLTPFTRLSAIYLSGNSFTAETPLKIGVPKPDLTILEIDIVDHLDQSFNLSDYPSIVAFDAYHNMDLHSIDPTGCPDLAVLSVEMTDVASIDVSQNPNLLRLNIAETRVKDVDLSHNPKLEHFLANHDSGTINTDCHLNGINLSHNPMLTILNLNGNGLKEIDLSANTRLTNLSLSRNSLTSLDLSKNTALYSIWILNNDLDFATLPAPQPTWGEYFYPQNELPVARAIEKGSTLDLSARVLREGTQTSARVWRQIIDNEDELLDESLYSYADGKISFPQAIADSVYVEFANTLLCDYTLKTRPFRVKTSAEMNQPSRILTFTPGEFKEISFAAGLYGASATEPKKLLVDFGNGQLKEFTTDFALKPTTMNITGTPVGLVSVYVPEGEVLTSFSISGVALGAADLTKATELAYLSITDGQLYDLDTRYNRCLQYLDLSGNNLSALDLTGIYGDYEKNVLTTIKAARNNISSYKNMATTALRHLDLSANRMEEINLKDYDNLLTLDLSDNLLTSVDLEYMFSATDINLSGNRLSAVNPCATSVPDNLDLSHNNLTFASLPWPSSMGSGYVYAPQNDIKVPAQAPTVNLSAQNVTIDGNPTVFTWKKTDGTLLSEGTDFRIAGGITTFLDSSLGDVFCELSNASFPMLAGDRALRTTAVRVTEVPSQKVATFTTDELTGNASVIFAATEPCQLYIDWNGDGSELTPYEVGTSYLEYPVTAIKPGAEVKILASTPEIVRSINVFSIYGIRMHGMDLSPLTGVYSLNIGGAGISADDVTMPVAPGMGELTLSDNAFTSFPYAKDYPNLHTLNLSGNRIEEFDASEVPSAGYLTISRNGLKSIHFDNPLLWSVMADNNSLETIDLTGLPALEQILLNSNLLSSIDLTPVQNTLSVISLVSNRFRFSTLPSQDACPRLSVFYYGNQAPLDVKCEDMKVDLSSEAEIDGIPTSFTWYAGIPEYDAETGEIIGNLLAEGTDYSIDNGVTTFLRSQPEKVLCVMTNEAYPNLTLITDLISVQEAGVDNPEYDATHEVSVYSLQGILLRKAPATTATDGLPNGIYIIDGRKISVRN